MTSALRSATASSSVTNVDVQPPTVISMPLWKKSITPINNITGSWNSRPASAMGNPCGCLGAGKVVAAITANGTMTSAPTPAMSAG